MSAPTPDVRAKAALPAAAALVCAVADHDPDEVARILADVTDWQALVVVLAGHVPTDTALTGSGHLGPEAVALRILTDTARRFDTTIGKLRSTDRHRHVTDARAVAMAAMRYAGLTSVFTGQQVCRDHTTVLHAATRVGESAHLRQVALDIAQLNADRPAELGDEAA